MTVIRLADGGLFLHSPTPLSSELADALRHLGPVRYIVAPSRFHHLHLGPYSKAFPEAEFHGTKRLLTKRRDIPWKGVLSDSTPAPWHGDIRQVTFRGSIILDDVVFYDPKAGILILTDLVQFHECREGSLHALVARMLGVYQRYGVPRDIRWTILGPGRRAPEPAHDHGLGLRPYRAPPRPSRSRERTQADGARHAVARANIAGRLIAINPRFRARAAPSFAQSPSDSRRATRPGARPDGREWPPRSGLRRRPGPRRARLWVRRSARRCRCR